jgi:carbon storage regulator CsrA
MLVLSRKRNEDIIIGEGDKKVIVRVVEIVGDKVRLGFVADQSVTILRAEVPPNTQEKTNGLERPAPGGPFYSFQ